MKIPVTKFVCAMLLTLLCASSGSLAQEKPEGNDAAAASAAGGPLLWKVTSATSTIFLFGSIHFATEEIYPLPQHIEAAFDAADHLVVELNVGPEQQGTLAQMMMARGSYATDESLADHLSEKVEGDLTRYLAATGVPAEAFDKFKPWLVALTISVMEMQKLGLDPALGVDQHFLGRARGSKPILELETTEEQLAVFDSLSEQMQQLMLKKTLLEIDKIGVEMHQMLDAWTRGDAAAMQELMFKSLNEAPELKPFFDKMFTERNLKMADRITGFLGTDSTYFVVVGAGHLVGDDGIVALLKGKEFPVERQ